MPSPPPSRPRSPRHRDPHRTADAAPHADVDVVCLGESMVTFLPSRPGRLADVPSFDRAIGGAESNVACALAARRAPRAVGQPGRRGRLRRPPGGGDRARTASTSAAVGRDPAPPDRHLLPYGRRAGPDHLDAPSDAAEVVYYRAGSAASAMSPGTVDLAAVRRGRGAAPHRASRRPSPPTASALMRELTAPRRRGRPLVSFDVNYRVGLWRRPPTAARTSCSNSPAAATSSSSARTRPRPPGAYAAARRPSGRRCREPATAGRQAGRATEPPRSCAGRRTAPTPSPSSPPCASTSSPPSAPATPSPPASSPPPCAACPYATGCGTATSWPPPRSPSPATSPHPPRPRARRPAGGPGRRRVGETATRPRLDASRRHGPTREEVRTP